MKTFIAKSSSDLSFFLNNKIYFENYRLKVEIIDETKIVNMKQVEMLNKYLNYCACSEGMVGGIFLLLITLITSSCIFNDLKFSILNYVIAFVIGLGVGKFYGKIIAHRKRRQALSKLKMFVNHWPGNVLSTTSETIANGEVTTAAGTIRRGGSWNSPST